MSEPQLVSPGRPRIGASRPSSSEARAAHGCGRHSIEPELEALRSLALRFRRPAAIAEDIVQEACLTALLRPPKEDDVGRWCADTVRRLVGRVLASERHRREREKRVARPEAQPSVLDIVTELEVLTELHRSLERLDMPYRSMIRMRFLEDLPPRVIASRLHLPVNTVRTQIHRGLLRLRTSLDPTVTL